MKTDPERPSVTIMVGLPGSGKSFARAEAADGPSGDSYQYSTDDYIEKLAADAGMTYNEGFKDFVKEATAIANKEVAEAIVNERSVLWDQTNMSAKKRKGILSKFGSVYRKECICILPPFTAEQQIELERRLADRPGKDIPDFVMANMLKSFVLPSTAEGFDRILYFDIYGKMVDPTPAIPAA